MFHENKQWFLSTWKYEPPNLFLTCVVGLPGTDMRLLASTPQFTLPVQSPLDLSRWKLIQLLKVLQLKGTLSVLLCCEVGHAIGFLQFCIHTLCTLDICTQEANQMKSFLLECLPFKSPVVTLRITRFNIQKSYVQLVSYCSNMFWPQLVAIFKEVVSFFDTCSLCTHLSDRNSTCLTEIILKIKKLKHEILKIS